MPANVDGLINFSKRRKIAELLLLQVERWQLVPLDFGGMACVPAACEALRRLETVDQEEEAFQKSLALEPPLAP
jgi:hypothetical protein